MEKDTDDLEKIKELEEIVSKNIDREEMYLLKEGLECYKKKLYSASASVLRVFQEKYLREILINKKSKNGKGSYDEIERHYEDGLNQDEKKFFFDQICKELSSKEFDFMDEISYRNCVEVYKKSRIPIQHGIYRRFVNDWTEGNKEALNKKEFKKTLKEYKELSGINDKLYKKDIRLKSLPILFKSHSNSLINGIYELMLSGKFETYLKL